MNYFDFKFCKSELIAQGIFCNIGCEVRLYASENPDTKPIIWIRLGDSIYYSDTGDDWHTFMPSHPIIESEKRILSEIASKAMNLRINI